MTSLRIPATFDVADLTHHDLEKKDAELRALAKGGDMTPLVRNLREEAERLSGLSLDRGVQEAGISANLADRAADVIEEYEAREILADRAHKVMTAEIEKLQRNLRHWREECGKLHARVTSLINQRDDGLDKLQAMEKERSSPEYDPTTTPFDEPFRHAPTEEDLRKRGVPENILAVFKKGGVI